MYVFKLVGKMYAGAHYCPSSENATCLVASSLTWNICRRNGAKKSELLICTFLGLVTPKALKSGQLGKLSFQKVISSGIYYIALYFYPKNAFPSSSLLITNVPHEPVQICSNNTLYFYIFSRHSFIPGTRQCPDFQPCASAKP